MEDENGLKDIIDKIPESVRFKFRKEVCLYVCLFYIGYHKLDLAFNNVKPKDSYFVLD